MLSPLTAAPPAPPQRSAASPRHGSDGGVFAWRMGSFGRETESSRPPPVAASSFASRGRAASLASSDDEQRVGRERSPERQGSETAQPPRAPQLRRIIVELFKPQRSVSDGASDGGGGGSRGGHTPSASRALAAGEGEPGTPALLVAGEAVGGAAAEALMAEAAGFAAAREQDAMDSAHALWDAHVDNLDGLAAQKAEQFKVRREVRV